MHHDETGDMTPEEEAEHEEISRIEDFLEWHYASGALWARVLTRRIKEELWQSS